MLSSDNRLLVASIRDSRERIRVGVAEIRQRMAESRRISSEAFEVIAKANKALDRRPLDK